MSKSLSATGISVAWRFLSGTRMKLEIGYDHAFEIRKELIRADCRDPFNLLYLSDLHFTRFSGRMVQRIMEAINHLDPTIILFGGDYVDSQKGFDHLQSLLVSISGRKNLYAIAGNHDFYMGIEKIKE